MKKENILLSLMAILVLFGIYIRRYDETTMDFYNSDAPYHIVLTMMGYRETPASDHLFLPIATMGEDLDKYIPWDVGLPDPQGENYYYTSFGPMAFFVPYVFLSLFALPLSTASLYWFNSCLYLLTFALCFLLFSKLFAKYLSKTQILFLSTFYLFSPEILHGMGLCYWAHSLSQVMILLQIYCYLQLRKKDPHRKEYNKFRFAFLLICLIFPYLEWTGYLANGISSLLVGFDPKIQLVPKKNTKEKTFSIGKHPFHLGNFFLVAGITTLSLLLFVGHYALVVDMEFAFSHVYGRFSNRSLGADVTFGELFSGYYTSFSLLIIINLVLSLLVLSQKRTRMKFLELLKEYTFVFLFFGAIMIENIIMLEHAISYSFDRMKLVFLLMSFLILCVITIKECKILHSFEYLPSLCFLCAILGLQNYILSSGYTWNYMHGEENRILSQSLEEKLPEDQYLLFQPMKVRGYACYLFQKGIYQGYFTTEEMLEIAQEKQVPYAVKLIGVQTSWNKHNYLAYELYDVQTGEKLEFYVVEGEN